MLLYKILSTAIFLTILPVYYLVRACQGKFLYGWNIKLGLFGKQNLGDKVIMFHGVSVGEIIALENLVKATKNTFPDYKIVVTTGTKTGQDIAQKKFKDIADLVTYFPFDIAPCVNRFLKNIKPTVILMAETEIWPTFVYACKDAKILLYNINGRMSDSTYNLYKFIKSFFKHVLSQYTGILTQSNEDAQKLISIGAPKNIVKVMKNLKFDIKKSNDTINIEHGNSRVIIAGSTHHGENEIVLDTFVNLRQEFSDIKLLIAPRHIERVPMIKQLAKKKNLKYGLRSNDDNFTDNDVIILDTLGELSRAYAMCNIAFIGGSFNKTGGHNPLEATVYSKPAISGPSIHNFKDIYTILGRSKAGKVVKTPNELECYLKLLLKDKEFYNQACEDCSFVFNDNQGALDVVIDTLKDVL